MCTPVRLRACHRADGGRHHGDCPADIPPPSRRGRSRLAAVEPLDERSPMKAVRFSAFGPPLDVVEVVDEQVGAARRPARRCWRCWPRPSTPRTCSRSPASTALLPKLPAVPGNEGVGRVVEVSGSTAPCGWATSSSCPWARAPGAPTSTPRPSACCPCRRARTRCRGDAVHQPAHRGAAAARVRQAPARRVGLQNAANSAVGRYLITLAQREGTRRSTSCGARSWRPELHGPGRGRGAGGRATSCARRCARPRAARPGAAGHRRGGRRVDAAAGDCAGHGRRGGELRRHERQGRRACRPRPPSSRT